MNLTPLSRITRGLLCLLWLLVLGCLLGVYLSPGAAAIFSDYYGFPMQQTIFYVFVSAAGLLALWILTELLLIMRTVEAGPFVRRNVRAFFRMGVAAETAGILFAGKCLLYFTPMTAVCSVVMVLAGLFSLVMCGVFRAAVEAKEENDLTI